MTRHEMHRVHRVGWLRASVLGANDGVVSTASLIIGVAAAQSDRAAILVAGLAGLVAGAMSMAAGEYVSVSSQADTEQADLETERRSLETDFLGEVEELAQIYVSRGLEAGLARTVAEQMMARDALGTHAREEMGILDLNRARPIQAAVSSASAFTVGASLPLGCAWIVHGRHLVPVVAGTSLLFLASLGALAAQMGGAALLRGALRVTLWGAFAMALTAGVGHIFGVTA